MTHHWQPLPGVAMVSLEPSALFPPFVALLRPAGSVIEHAHRRIGSGGDGVQPMHVRMHVHIRILATSLSSDSPRYLG
eukprot:CAMPEP_0195084664 /NCGR_PEP_ID=MMETSP0448-20130528/25298_1 /TAXON_ID=66468 /ORGANISM="Heterocapsa triquestra, Strain CCMP 448" /LENGTH=77 /DNA_ID=CAMNT_0040118009 /DNA_START=156 /DNA_END=389 /DNA_ORIENTATION=-